jgi:hypothetical protein
VDNVKMKAFVTGFFEEEEQPVVHNQLAGINALTRPVLEPVGKSSMWTIEE